MIYGEVATLLDAQEARDTVRQWIGHVDGMRSQVQDVALLRQMYVDWQQRKNLFSQLREIHKQETGEWPHHGNEAWQDRLVAKGLYMEYLHKESVSKGAGQQDRRAKNRARDQQKE